MNGWTTTPPTAPGTYWWRYENSQISMILTVIRTADGRLMVWDRNGAETPVDRWPGGMGAGPIEPPPIED